MKTIYWIIAVAVAFVLGGLGGRSLEQASTSADVDSGQTKSYRPAVVTETSGSAQVSDRGLSGSGEGDGVVMQLRGFLDSLVNYSTSDLQSTLEGLNPRESREDRFKANLLVSHWAEIDPEGARNFLEGDNELEDYFSATMMGVVYSTWAKYDVEAVAASIENSDTDKKFLTSQSINMVRQWAESDPARAMEWLQSFDKDKAHKGPSYTYILESVAENSPAEVSQYLEKLEGSEYYRYGVSGAAKVWGRDENWSNVEQNLASLPEDAQAKARIDALYSFTKVDPYEASAQISNIEEASREKNALVEYAVRFFDDENPGQTLEWALSNVTEGHMNRISNRVVGPWISEEPNEVAQWVLTQPNDKATRMIAKRVLNNEDVSSGLKDQINQMIEN